jgi:hypothetical protein
MPRGASNRDTFTSLYNSPEKGDGITITAIRANSIDDFGMGNPRELG